MIVNDNTISYATLIEVQKNAAINGRLICALLVVAHLWLRAYGGSAYEAGLGLFLAIMGIAFAWVADVSVVNRLPAALVIFASIASAASVGASILFLLLIVW